MKPYETLESVKHLPTSKQNTVIGAVTEIERYSLHDGKGIRTTIFLKGCPLNCRWCSNPETQAYHPEMAYIADRCIFCLACVKACQQQAISIEDHTLNTDRTICEKTCYRGVNGFECVTACFPEARIKMGQEMSVSEVLKEINRDSHFYQSSGGGITISGGEPMAQAGFVYALLREAKNNWIDTAIETCGIGKTADYLELLPYLNTVFMDLKTTDTILHREWTGVENQIILNNLAQVSKAAHKTNTTFCIRIPVVGGFNDNMDSMESISQFICTHCANNVIVELLPYHKLGRGKYNQYDRICGVYNLEPPSASLMSELTDVLLRHEINIVEF